MSTTDTQLAELLGKNAELFAAYEIWANGQIMLLAGTVDDPASFNAEGGKTGALGYYPVVNVSGQTIYVPCIARLQAMAMGSTDPAVLEGLLSSGVAQAAEQVTLAAQQVALAGQERQAAGVYAGDAATAQAGAETARADTEAKLATSKDQLLAADRLRKVMPTADMASPEALQLIASGDLGKLIMAFLDASGFLGAGLTADGVLAAGKLRALTSILTPLLGVSGGGSIALGSGASVDFTGDGKIKGASGASLSMQRSNYDLVVSDPAGHPLIGWKDGKLYGPRSVTTATDKRINIAWGTGAQVDMGQHNYDFCVADPSGNVLLGWMNGVFYSPIGAVGSVDLDAQDAANKAHTQSVYLRRVTTVQKPTAALNALYLYGQSLGQGDETWPALSRANRFGNLMLGGNTMSSTDNGVFTQFTPTGLQPLASQTVNGSSRYDAAGEAALAAGNGSRGEPPNIGWANGAKARFNDYLVVANASDRSFVSINISKSGATIGELRKNHTQGTTEYYGKFTGSLTQLLTAAASSTAAVAGITFMQGEHDYQTAARASTNVTYAKYKAELIELAATMQADAITATGQPKPPAFLIYQTGAAYTRDVDMDGMPGMHVGMAQLDFSLASNAAWMVGPVHPYTDKGGHFDSNGSRWFGHQIAKVWHHVVVEGRDWEPMRPLRIWQEGTSTIYVGYHVPHGPIAFDTPRLNNGNVYNNASRGFRLTDTQGAVGVGAVEIVRDTIIKITTTRPIVGAAQVWYASQGTTGNGMVRDSDPTVASDLYVFEPERGMYATANIPELVNKPYPLWNWSIGFYLPVGFKD